MSKDGKQAERIFPQALWRNAAKAEGLLLQQEVLEMERVAYSQIDKFPIHAEPAQLDLP
jgi:hypothetical protein